MVEGAFEDDSRRTGNERRVNHVAVADDPADVGHRPPHLSLPESHQPSPHGGDVDGGFVADGLLTLLRGLG